MPGTAPRQSGADRLVGVDVLRAVSIAVVLGIHWDGAGLVKAAGAETWLAFIFFPGAYGVTLFFVISGFLICRTTMQREPDFFRLSLASFYIRRVARIQPLFLASVAIGLVALALGNPADELFRFVFNNPDATSVSFWLSLFSFTYNWFRIVERAHDWAVGLQWNVLWSLAVEEQFYLLFPLAVIFVRQWRRLVVLLLIFMILGPAARLIADMYSMGWTARTTNSFACFDALAFGVLAALLSERLSLGVGARRMLVAAGSGLLLAAYFWPDFVMAPTALAFGADLFILGAIGEGLFVSPLWRPFARVGELSYGLYLLHPAVLYVLSPWLRQMSFSGGFAVYFIATVGLAALSHRYFEEPANRFIRSRLTRRRTIALELG